MNRLITFPARGFTPKTVSTNGNGKHPAPPQSKALVLDPRLFGDTFYHGLASDSVYSRTAYAAYWLAYACIDYRKTKLCEPPLWIQEETDDAPDGEWIAGEHELSDLLERPNPDMRMSEFMEIVSICLDTSDIGCLIVKSRDRSGRVGALYPFGEGEFQVESSTEADPPGKRLRGKFTVLTADGRQVFWPDDVIWLRHTDPSNHLGSLPPLRAALEHLGIGRELVAAIKTSLLRAIRPGAIIEYPGNFPDQEALNVFRSGTQVAHSGTNRGGLMVVTGGATFKPMDSGMESLAIGPVQEDVEAAVCAAFKVPPLLVLAKLGLKANGGWADATGPMRELFYDNVAFPMWAKVSEALTYDLLREVDPAPRRFIRFDTTRVRALQMDLVKRTTEMMQARDVWTVNEGRVHTGQEAFPEDDPRGEQTIAEASSGGRVPLDLSGIFGGGTRDEPAPDATDDDEEADTSDDERPRLSLVKRKAKALERKANRRTTWTVIDAITRTAEAYIEVVAKGLIDADQREILQRLEGRTKADPVGPMSREEAERRLKEIDAYLDGESPEQWRIRLRPIIEAVARQSVERTAASLGIDFGLVQPGLADYVEREVATLVTQVSETTKADLRATIGAGLAEGETTATIAKRVREAGPFSPARAKLIARTESTRASNGATVDTMGKYAKEHGVTVLKSWLTSGDARVRPEHAAIDDETVPIDEPFSNGRMHPDEPNCRCSITTEVRA